MSLIGKLFKGLRRGPAAPQASLGIDPTALMQRLAERQDLLVLDVRNGDEFAGPLGHIDGAINLPLADLRARLLELEAYRERPIIVVCLTDRRSVEAVRQLADAGFSKPVLLHGGMTAWHAAHLPVVART